MAIGGAVLVVILTAGAMSNVSMAPFDTIDACAAAGRKVKSEIDAVEVDRYIDGRTSGVKTSMSWWCMKSDYVAPKPADQAASK